MTQNPNDDMELEMMEAFTSEKSDKEIGMPDIEQELARVMEGRGHAASPMRKQVAMIVAAFVISGIAVAAIFNHEAISHFFSGEATATAVVEKDTAKQTAINPLLIMPSDTAKVEQGRVMFENAELVNIMTSICNTYKKDVVFRNENLKHVRLHFQYNTEDKLEDVIQSLNMFEKFSVRMNNNKLEVELHEAVIVYRADVPYWRIGNGSACHSQLP